MAGPTLVDVHLMTFLVNCLNGPLYRRSMKQTNKVLGQDKDDDAPAYHLQIGQPNDNIDINIHLNPDNVDKTDTFRQRPCLNQTFYREAIDKWSKQIIPDFGLDRKYKTIAHTMKQPPEDESSINHNDNTTCKFIIPIFDKQWRLIDVEMPSDRNKNGMVKIIDSSSHNVQQLDMSHIFLLQCGTQSCLEY